MKLWLIRHAKSSWSQRGMSDFDRPLNARGERDGPTMASWLSQQEFPAQWIWTSDARRAQATAEFVREGFSLTADQLEQVHELYLADPETMLDVIRRTPAGHQQRGSGCAQSRHHLPAESAGAHTGDG